MGGDFVLLASPVSIHAPARGATVFLVLPDTLRPIAIVPRTTLAIKEFLRIWDLTLLHRLISWHCESLGLIMLAIGSQTTKLALLQGRRTVLLHSVPLGFSSYGQENSI